MTQKETYEAIDVLRTLLGTMVMLPKYKVDPNNIAGEPTIVSNNQHPIVEGKDREIVKNKMIELINMLG